MIRLVKYVGYVSLFSEKHNLIPFSPQKTKRTFVETTNHRVSKELDCRCLFAVIG
jgi:hypothetical protein